MYCIYTDKRWNLALMITCEAKLRSVVSCWEQYAQHKNILAFRTRLSIIPHAELANYYRSIAFQPRQTIYEKRAANPISLSYQRGLADLISVPRLRSSLVGHRKHLVPFLHGCAERETSAAPAELL